MGGSESFVDNYIRQYGEEGLFKLVLLKKKISWLEEICSRQLDRKVDDEIKHILFQVDENVNEKKQITLQLYKQTKAELVQKEPRKVSNFEENKGRLLENLYGKNHMLDKFNSLKINFHIEVHLAKKKIKKAIEQKIRAMENHLLYQTSDIPIPKHAIEMCFKKGKKQSQPVLDNSELKMKLEEFKIQIIQELDFNLIFWPYFHAKIRKTENAVHKIYNEVETNINTMKKDLYMEWTFFNA